MKLVYSLIALFLIPSFVHGYGLYMSNIQMITKSEIIALVQISKVEKTETKSTHWNYHQVATAKVERTLKGTLPPSVV
jgi:hypothetical protein